MVAERRVISTGGRRTASISRTSTSTPGRRRARELRYLPYPGDGGESVQLDSNPGYDDGPDYSPDGKWIYFNSDRAGSWDVWRIPAGGAGPGDAKAEQITNDDMEDWFPHPSPDGKWLVFLTFAKGTADAQRQASGHTISHDADARGRLAKAPKIEVVTTFFGGQGTINVNSWSPDSKRFAFVIYEPLPAAGGSISGYFPVGGTRAFRGRP